MPVIIPNGVTVELDSRLISVLGPKGKLAQSILDGIRVNQDNNQLIVVRDNDLKISKSNHGLMRSLINNLVIGVSIGFIKKLEINGVGYKASVSGNIFPLTSLI